MPSTSEDLAEVYRDLHAHPELGFAEHRTAAIVAERLTGLGFEVTTGVGRTGVVGILRNGAGPTALLRADMDGLPVAEATGLPYASIDTAPGEGGEVPVMHACGHDMHVTALLGAAERLAADSGSWAGTLMLVFQPAEELGAGAQAMLDDGLFERFGRPDVVLGQHVAPIPAGVIGLRSGPAFAAADVLRIVLHGRGAHGSRPEVSVDPVVMAAATVMRLQTVVSREVGGSETAVVTVGKLTAGTAANIIPDHAELLITVRTFTVDVRDRVVAAIRRIVCAEAAASDAPTPPDVELTSSFPAVSNDHAAVERTRPALQAIGVMVVDPGPVTGSEDVGLLAIAAGVPCVYWLLGGADPAVFAGAADFEEIAARTAALPSNHSPLFAPVIEPTLSIGVNALVAAARTWLPITAVR
jgi:amidohydrolase